MSSRATVGGSVQCFGVLALIFQGTSDINIVPDYLYLLGFPALALMLSKGITQQKLANNDIVKVAPDATSAAVAGTAATRGWRSAARATRSPS